MEALKVGDQKYSWGKGKENCMGPPASLQQSKEKQILQEIQLKDSNKSKLPVPSKAKPPPDFKKMHQAWQNQFQKGKAVSKKSCTRPQPFNLSQKGDRFRVASVTDMGYPETSSFSKKSSSPVAGPMGREPLTEVLIDHKKTGKSTLHSKDIPVMEFKADLAALTSILSNAGVSIPGTTTGKLSLAQRVPMRGSSTCRNLMVRNSVYTAPCSQPTYSDDRMSCFSWLPAKGAEQKCLFRQKQQCQKQPCDTSLQQHPPSREDCALPSQVNPVLQQMNLPDQSLPFSSQEDFVVTPTPAPETAENVTKADSSVEKIATATKKNSAEKRDLLKDSSDKQNSVGDFVADSQALASILSNTGVTAPNCGKLSLAQRVPVQGRNMSFRGNNVTSGSLVGQTTPKPAFGRVSVVVKDAVLSSCRVPKNTQTPTDSPGGRVRRINHGKCSSKKFSQQCPSTMMQPIFPKTPRALALEMANKRLEADHSDLQSSSKRIVKWADEPSPVSVILCEDEPPLEQVAVRLFSDGEYVGNAEEKEQIPASVSEPIPAMYPITASIQGDEESVMCESSITNNDKAAADCHALHLDLASLRIPNCTENMQSSLPLSFLAHPAVQALQSSTLGSQSLPRIARLRLHSALSAKQRFWDTCLDEECAFYTSRGAAGSSRTTMDPVAITLDRQEDLHFIPIGPGESSLLDVGLP
ncbi:tastin [Rhinophrynus dorsalis]